MGLTCFYCHSFSTEPRQGWRTSGGYAMICDRCASAYEEGRFCCIFHLNADGWRGCVTCEKEIHCGCIMSEHLHTMLDFGGIKCIECSEKNNEERKANEEIKKYSKSESCSKSYM